MWFKKVFLVTSLVLLLSITAVTTDLINPKESENENLSFRLPNNTIPISYELKITTYFQDSDYEKFTGQVKIHIKILQETRSITLHSRNLEINQINIWTLDGFPVINDADYELIESHEFLVIKLPTVYQPDMEFLIDISYQGAMNGLPYGLFITKYENNDNMIEYIAATQFKPHHARQAIPCFDEPGIRAIFNLTLVYGTQYNADSNTQPFFHEPLSDITTTTFAPTPPIQVYTLAFVIHKFTYINSTDIDRIPQRIFGPIDQLKAGNGNFAASIVDGILKKYESLLGVQFPLLKLDHMPLVYLSQQTMENFGIATYTMYALMNEEFGPYNNEDIIIESTIRQFAGQWFGNIVSPAWWSYNWLNDGFMEFFQTYMKHLLHPDDNIMDRFYIFIIPLAFMSDDAFNWSMNRYVEDPSMLYQKFNDITTKKAACIIRMFMESLTEDVFIKGLTSYLRNNFLKAAEPSYLHAALQAAYDDSRPVIRLDINKAMSSWEDQAGYPLITVDVNKQALIIQQRKYTNDAGEEFVVPITIATKTSPGWSSKTPSLWLESYIAVYPMSLTLYREGDWIIINKERTGYYRVDYSWKLWNRIIKQLNEDHQAIHRPNRYVLVDEFDMAYFEFQRVFAADGLELISYLGKEDFWRIWAKAESILFTLQKNLFGTEVYEKFQGLLRDITKPHLEVLKYENRDGEPQDVTIFRGTLKYWNCLADDGECLAFHFLRFIRGDSVEDLCSALRIVPERVFNETIKMIIEDQNMLNRNIYIYNMGCTLDERNMDLILETVLDKTNGLSNFDREHLLSSTTRRSSMGLRKCLKFMQDHFEDLSGLLDSFSTTLSTMINGIKDKETISEFENLLDNLVFADLISIHEQDVYLEQINANLDWQGVHYHEVKVFFGLAEPTTTTTTTTTTRTTTTSTTTPAPPTSTSTTTQPPSTTTTPKPDSGSTIFVSFSLIVICLVVHFVKV